MRFRSVMRLQAAADESAGICTILDITLLDGRILWDWDAYVIGLQIGMQLQFRDFDGGDPVAYLCTAWPAPTSIEPLP